MTKPRQEFLGPITKLAAIITNNNWVSDGNAIVDGYNAKIIDLSGVYFSSSAPNPIISQTIASSMSGASLTIQAQQGAYGYGGGDLLLEGGLGGSGGSAGTIRLGVGGFTGINIATGGGTFGQVNFSNGFTVTINDTVDNPAFTCNGPVYINNSAEIVGTLRCDNILDVYAGGTVPVFEVNTTSVQHINSTNSELHILSRDAGFSVQEDIQWFTKTSTISPVTCDITVSANATYIVEYEWSGKGGNVAAGKFAAVLSRVSGTLSMIGAGDVYIYDSSGGSYVGVTSPNNNIIRFIITPHNSASTTWTVKARILYA